MLLYGIFKASLEFDSRAYVYDVVDCLFLTTFFIPATLLYPICIVTGYSDRIYLVKFYPVSVFFFQNTDDTEMVSPL